MRARPAIGGEGAIRLDCAPHRRSAAHAEARPTDLTKVASVHDPGTAGVVKSMLESAGIPVLLQPKHAAISLFMFPGTGGGPGPVDVFVPAECATDAAALLAQTQPDEADA
jgi:hypothetical protein